MQRTFLGVLLVIVLTGTAVLMAEDLQLDILWTNDIHGGIDPYEATFMNPDFPPTLGGGGSHATYVNNIRKLSGDKRDNFLIDAGDFFQGHPIGTVTKGKAVIDYMNKIGYDLLVLGNHEYDIGEEELKKTLSLAEFPILSCNIFDRSTGKLVSYAEPYRMFEKMGLRIAVIGVTTTDTKMMSFPENIKNVEFRPAKPEVEKYIKIVREKENADIVILVGHMGLPYSPEPAYQQRYIEKKEEEQEARRWGYDAQEIAHEVQGIDLMVGGHIHKGIAEPWEDPVTHTLVVQGYAYGSGIGHITLTIDPVTKTVSGYELPAMREGMMVTMFEDEFIPEPEIAAAIAEQQEIAEAGMDEVIGTASIHLTKDGDAQSLIGNMVCDAMVWAGDADFSFLNLGGIRGAISKGPITYRDVFNVMPFDNAMVVLEIDGKLLKDIIELRVSGSRHGLRTSGAKIVYSRKRADFDRVTALEIQGEPWQADKIYKVATTDFLLQGNAGLAMLTKLPESQITMLESTLRDNIVNYIKKNSPVSAKIDDRWQRDDEAEMSKILAEELSKLPSKKN
ncbi:MAG: bifunctional metallophosphatase/5'-nucleotidase [Candidatus Cloacimonetes bacterium]|nr:bifunctional metallophosphatase/5'-nucleotidase [Candidatus Cloacimonadota bacterium]